MLCAEGRGEGEMAHSRPAFHRGGRSSTSAGGGTRTCGQAAQPLVCLCVQVHVAWLVGAPEFLLTPLLQRWTLANMQSSELLVYFN